MGRGLKFSWNMSILSKYPHMYIGIVDSQHIKTIYKNENYEIPYITASDYFSSRKYHGYGLCISTGDVYHNNARYGKPYVVNLPTNKMKKFILSMELDLTAKFYGTLQFLIYPMDSNDHCTQYWSNQMFAYDDVLVHKKYHLVVSMGRGQKLILFDETVRSRIIDKAKKAKKEKKIKKKRRV